MINFGSRLNLCVNLCICYQATNSWVRHLLIHCHYDLKGAMMIFDNDWVYTNTKHEEKKSFCIIINIL